MLLLTTLCVYGADVKEGIYEYNITSPTSVTLVKVDLEWARYCHGAASRTRRDGHRAGSIREFAGGQHHPASVGDRDCNLGLQSLQ